MRPLHVVGVSPDGSKLLLAAEPGANPRHAGFSIAIDADFEKALRASRRKAPEGPELSPRDIQAALRAGASVESLANKAGVPIDRIERYAGPVYSERIRIIAEAVESFSIRPRLGRSKTPLGAAVTRNLGETPPDEAWSAKRTNDGWRVLLKVSGRGRTRNAQWRFEPTDREVWPMDSLAASIGHIEGRKTPAKAPVKKVPVKRTAAKKTPVKKTPAKKTAAKKAPAKKRP